MKYARHVHINTVHKRDARMSLTKVKGSEMIAEFSGTKETRMSAGKYVDVEVKDLDEG